LALWWARACPGACLEVSVGSVSLSADSWGCISGLWVGWPEEEFRVMIVKMIQELWKRMDAEREVARNSQQRVRKYKE